MTDGHTDDQTKYQLDDDSQRYDEVSRGSGATILFWALVGFLICLGVCVIVSIVLALVYGS